MSFDAFDALRQCQDVADRNAETEAVLALVASPAVTNIWSRPDVIDTVENFATARDSDLAAIAIETAQYIRWAEDRHAERLAEIEARRAARVLDAHELFESRQRGFIQHHAWRIIQGLPPKVCHLFRVNDGRARLASVTARSR